MPSDPPPAEVLALAARHLLERGRLDLAREVAAAALAEDARCANAHSVMHVVCDELGDWVAGLGHARRAAELLPGSAQLRYNLALSALRLDDYRAGFALMEARIDKPDWTGLAIAPSRAAERHHLLRPGMPVEGRHILVVCEQGLGDCIMFARCLPLLAARGARITLVCSPPLRPVFERVAGIDALLSPPSDQPFAKINLSQADFDFWVPLLSLPHYFATEFGTVPAGIPYLTADPARIALWRQRYTAKSQPGAARIGLVFHANPVSASATGRSIPIADLAPLLRLPGLDWVNLQGGAAGRELAAAYPKLIDATREETSLDEFAAAIAATDLVVSVDTMAAHCAGALGHPLYLLVPFSPHWCWGIARDRTPWYPTARLFRQDARADWRNAVGTMARALATSSSAQMRKHDSAPSRCRPTAL
jgi:ADP-heptose:LPS heptosyltransferase